MERLDIKGRGIHAASGEVTQNRSRRQVQEKHPHIQGGPVTLYNQTGVYSFGQSDLGSRFDRYA